eukprot:11110591-Prorocentrum_lima.AAC.1
MVQISIAPIVQACVHFANEFGVGPSWELMNLYPNLQEQLLKCRPTQATGAEPVNAMDIQEAVSYTHLTLPTICSV